MSEGTEGHVSLLAQAQATLREADPERVAALSGAKLERRDGAHVFTLCLLDTEVTLAHPSLELARVDGGPCAEWQRHLLTYYLSMADGTQPAGKWVALRDLPDGMFYQRAFEGYTGGDLVRAFGNDVEPFREACRALGAEALNTGDAGYRFLVLPKVWLAAIYWLGEEIIPPSARVLFDASIQHYLPTDSCAALGGWLADRIIEKHRAA
jgi:hypothetical protein